MLGFFRDFSFEIVEGEIMNHRRVSLTLSKNSLKIPTNINIRPSKSTRRGMKMSKYIGVKFKFA